MSETCPICEAEASKAIEVEMGDSWVETVSGPPHTIFAEYIRVCVEPEQARKARRRADEQVPVYFHRRSDLADAPY